VTLRSGHKTRKTLERIGRVYSWDDRPLGSISDDDAATMLAHIAVTRGKRAAANQTKHALHTMFKMGEAAGPQIHPDKPVRGPAGTGRGARPARPLQPTRSERSGARSISRNGSMSRAMPRPRSA
jgi:hypothetical protein